MVGFCSCGYFCFVRTYHTFYKCYTYRKYKLTILTASIFRNFSFDNTYSKYGTFNKYGTEDE